MTYPTFPCYLLFAGDDHIFQVDNESMFDSLCYAQRLEGRGILPSHTFSTYEAAEAADAFSEEQGP